MSVSHCCEPQADAPEVWPDLTDTGACRKWMDIIWSRPDFANAVRHASPSLAHRSDAIRAGRIVGDKQIRRATAATARYLPHATYCAPPAVPLPSACSRGWPSWPWDGPP
jgi:hypothetical protein